MAFIVRFAGLLCLGLAVSQVHAQFAPPPASTDAPAGAPVAAPSAPEQAAPSLISPAASLPATTQAANAKTGRGSEPLLPIRPSQTLTTNAMLGMINGEPIFVQDLLDPIDDKLLDLAAHSATLTEFTQQTRGLISNGSGTGSWDKLKMEILVSRAAEATLSDQDKKRVTDYVDEYRKGVLRNFGMSSAAADKAFLAKGSSLEKELRHQKRAAEQQLYYIETLKPRINVTYAMVRAYYENNIKDYKEPDQVTLYRITIPITRWLRESTTDGTTGEILKNPTPEQIHQAETNAMDEANELVKRMNQGGRENTFDEIALQFSEDAYKTDGGKVPGKVTRETYNDPELVSYIFSLPPDTIGKPLMLRDKDYTKTSVIIAKVKDKSLAHTIPFEQVQSDIKSKLFTQQLDDLEQKEGARLLREASVDAVDRNLDLAVSAAISRYATK